MWTTDCCFPGSWDSHRRHADSNWHLSHFLPMNGAFTNDLSLLLSISPRALLCTIACLSTRLGHTYLVTHTANCAHPTCHVPPPLGRSSQPGSLRSASRGVLSGSGGVWPSVDVTEATGRGRTGCQQVPAGVTLPAFYHSISTGWLTCQVCFGRCYCWSRAWV